MPTNAAHAWEEYRSRSLLAVTPLLAELGYTLDTEQPHLLGERFLMAGKRDVGGGGLKLVLLGYENATQLRVVIKISNDREGIREIETERRARETVRTLPFAYQIILVPDEKVYALRAGYRVFVTEYIEQEQPFVSLPLDRQFALALCALKAQEGFYASTSAHGRAVERTFGSVSADTYRSTFAEFCEAVRTLDPHATSLSETLARVAHLLERHEDTVEQYCGFLTHADFVPHNLRIRNDDVYLLDAASLHFGNKYESWARFLNFMLLYNRPLERALEQYVRDNRTQEEMLSLKLMRLYKLGKLLEYHMRAASTATGDVAALSRTRVHFWHTVMLSLLDETSISDNAIAAYQATRDSLRSSEEKKRQAALH